MEDEQIIALLEARSELGLAAAKARYEPYLTAIARRILGTEQDSEECVNDAWLRVWNAIPPARPTHLQAYLGAVTRNLAISRLRKQTARKRGGTQAELALEELREVASGEARPEEALLVRQLGEAVNDFLSRLNREKRVLFVLRYFELLGPKEIAARMGLREATVRSSLFRLRQQLRTYLEQEGIIE